MTLPVYATAPPQTVPERRGVAHPAARYGMLQLSFSRRGEQSVMQSSASRAPLQVMRAITDSAGCPNVYILSPTGGVVQRDHYDVQITVGEDAHALVTTLAATKVYRMPDDKAVQQVRIEVMPGAVLEYVPDTLILFADADFEQRIDIVLHEGALLVFQDAVTAGRIASGESLRFRRFVNQITVRDSQGLLLHERQEVRPQEDRLDRVGLLEGYCSWASWYLLGNLGRFAIDPGLFCERQVTHISETGSLLGSASRLYRDGLMVRLLTAHWSPMARQLERLRRAFRQDYLHLPATDLRKYE